MATAGNLAGATQDDGKFRNYINNSPDGVFIADERGRYLEVNPAASRITGYPEAELLGMSIPQLLPPEFAQLGADHFKAVVEQGASSGELPFIHKDGSTRWWTVDAVRLSTTRFLGFARDITARKRTEQALQDSEERRRLAQEAAKSGAWEWNLLTNENTWSEELWPLYGLEPNACVPSFEAWIQSVHADDRQTVARVVRDAASGGTELNAEWRVADAGVEDRWLMSRGKPVRDAQGRVTRYVGIVIDITERKRAELALAARRRELEALHRISEIALRDLPLRAKLLDIADAVAAATGFPIVAIEFYDEANQEMELAAAAGIPLAPGDAVLRIPVQQTWSGSVARNGLPLVVPQAGQQTEVSHATLRSHRVQTVVCVPMTAGARVLGTLSVASPAAVTVHEDILPLAGSLANFMASIVERERAEELLRESERSYRNQFSKNTAVMLLIDCADGSILDANDAALRFYGYSRAQILSLRITDINVQDAAQTRQDWASVPPDQGKRFEFQHRLAEGSVRDVEVAASVIQLGKRRVLHSIINDITERKQLEESLRETQSILQSAMDQSQAGIAIADAPSGRLRYVNDAGLLIRGAGRESVVKDIGVDQYVASWQLLDLDGTPLPADAVPLARAIRYGETNSREFIIRRSADDDRIVWANAAPIRDAAGRVTAAVVVFLDVTDRKRAEAALARSEAKHGKLVANIGDVITIIDRDGINRYKSPNIEKWFGWTPGEVVGKSAWELVHPQDVTHAQAFLASLLEAPHGASGTLECRYRCKDGAYKWIDFTGVNLKEDPEIRGLLGNYRDITGRKRAEEEQSRLHAALLQAQKMESVGRLAGGVAHDFNNMLGVILGHTEMALEQGELAPALEEDLKEIRSAARRSADLTRQLLGFARKQTAMPKVLDLNDTVAGMLKMVQRLIGENIELSWQPGRGVWPVRVDPTQVDQVLANLCLNARDAITGVGRITIHSANVRLEAGGTPAQGDALPGEYVLLAVGDDGCGMDEETLAHIFEPFFTTKGVGAGTGLGLATVYGVVRQNNGFISVLSEPGKGTMFHVHFPRYTGKDGPALASNPVGPTGRGNEIILLVEDEPAVRAVAAKMLTRQGYTVLAASTPHEALQLAQAHAGRIALLLTDVVMPEMNGEELAGQLQTRYPGLKRLFMSGYPADAMARRGAVVQDGDFIQKPFSRSAFVAKVREVLDR